MASRTSVQQYVGRGRVWWRSNILRFIGLLLPALAFVLAGQGAREAEAVLPPPPAVAEYDFGGSGPVGDLQFGGRAVAVDISPADRNVALVASATGGLWRTAAGGATWSHVEGFPMFFPHDVEYDPNDQNVVFATTDYDERTTTQAGIWRSTDGGTTWSRTSATYPCTTKPAAFGIGTVAGSDVHRKVFVANKCGVAYSNDSGTTWTNVDPSGGTPTEFFDAAAVRTGADTALAYACSGAAGLYSATVTGTAAPVWTQVSTTPPITNPATGSDWCQVAISPLDNNVVFVTNTNCPVSGACDETTFGARVYEVDIDTSATPSTVTVTDLNGPVEDNREPYVLTHRAVDGDASHFDLYFSNGFVFSRQHCSSDGNPATVDCTIAAETGSQCTNAVDDDGDQMVNEGCPAVGGAENGGAVPSQCKNNTDDDGDGAVNDGCPSMEHFDNGTHVDPTDIDFDPTAPGGTGCPLLTTNDGGVGRSTDCGATWADSNAGMRALQIYNVWGTLRGTGPTDTDIYFGTHDNEWWYSLDNGATWTKALGGEGFLGQADYRVPSGGLNNIRMVFVNCAGCGNNTSGRGFAGATAWPNPPGGAWGTDGLAAAPIMFGNQRYVQVGSDMGSPPSFRVYVMQPETGTQCSNSLDDDADGAVNEGCPSDGSPETAAQCHNAIDDDDGGSGAINEGCSHIFSVESGSECTNASDDDGDTVVNDGCPRVGSFSETGAQCLDAADDPDEDKGTAGTQDDDTVVNDGCPQVGVWGQMGTSFTERPNRAPIVPAGPATGPTFYFGVEASAGIWKLRKMSGPMNSTATMSDASGSGASGLNAVQQVGNQFYFPLVFAADPQNPAHLYAADTGTSEMKFSNDGGMTWQVDAELTALVTNNGAFNFLPWRIVYDPEDSQRILVATHSAGIIATVNGGQDWFTLQGSVNKIPMVTSFFFDRDHDVIYVTSFGRGLWTLTLPETDLSITKTDFPDPVMAGQELFYTITVTNNGPNPATAEVIDNLPPQVQYIGNDLAPPLGCTETSPGILRCAIGALDTGDSITFTIKVRVRSDAAVSTGGGSLTIVNTATVRSTDTSDPDPTNNTATATTFAEELSDLQVTKICKPDGPLLAGETGTCTIYVDNLGPSDARNVVMEDSIVSDGTFSIGTVTTSQGTCNPPTPGNVVHCDLGNLTARSPSNPGRATITIDVTATEQMDINDVATAVSATPDPNTANNQATESLNVSAVSDISLSKAGPVTAIAGTNITYNLTVANNGPSTAPGVVIEDVLPAGVTIVSVSGSGGATCNDGTPGDPFLPATCSYGTLLPAASRTMTITVKINPEVLGPIHNDAHASSGAFDDDLSNNFAGADTMVSAEADLAITKSATPNPVIAGTDLSYQINVTNNGPSLADDVVVVDPLPAALSFTGTSVSAPGLCGLETNTNTVTCHLGDLMPGETATIFIYTNVAASTLEGVALSNTATVSSATADPAGGNNSANVTTNVIARADLSVNLTSDKDVYKPSTVIHYVITVFNSGPSDSQSVVVTQNLPDKKIGFYVSNTAGCPVPVGTLFTCNLGTVKAGESKSFQLNFFIRGNKKTITQTATVTAATVDPDPSDNSSTRVVTVK